MAESVAVPEQQGLAVLTRRQALGLLTGSAFALVLGGCNSGESTPQTTLSLPDCGEDLVTNSHEPLTGHTDLLAYPWKLSGVEQPSSGLVVTPIQTLVETANGTYQSLFPMNMYGCSLEVSGELTLEADVDIPKNSQLAIQLSNELPLEFDDFILMRGGLRVATSQGQIVIEQWSGSDQQPITHVFSIKDTPSQKQHISLTQKNNQCIITVNGERVGSVYSPLTNGRLWLGLQATDTPVQISSLTATEAKGEVINTSTVGVAECASNGISREIKHRTRFLVGTAVALAPLVSDDKYASILSGNFNLVTAENALKPRDTQPVEGVFTFEQGDGLVDFAQRQGLKVWGHNLVWYKELPKWMNDLEAGGDINNARVKQVMLDHIRSVAGHYANRLHAWDVVNEPLAASGSSLRQNLWYQAMGSDYIAFAFQAAHTADPNAELWLNDYAMDKDGPGDEARFQALFAVAKSLVERGIRIDGIGFEGHVYEIPRDTMSPSALKRRMQQLATIGLKGRVSEMDVTTANGLDVQAQLFQAIFKACLETKNCVGFSMWGIGGPYVSTAGLSGNDFTFNSNLPWDNQLEPRLAYQALLETAAAS